MLRSVSDEGGDGVRGGVEGGDGGVGDLRRGGDGVRDRWV